MDKFVSTLRRELDRLPSIPNYKDLQSALNRAKTNSLGRMRPRPVASATNTKPETDRLDMALGAALEKHRINPSKVNLSRAQILEKDLCKKEKRLRLKAFSILFPVSKVFTKCRE